MAPRSTSSARSPTRGAGGAICYASGFREAESGGALQQALVLAAGSHADRRSQLLRSHQLSRWRSALARSPRRDAGDHRRRDRNAVVQHRSQHDDAASGSADRVCGVARATRRRRASRKSPRRFIEDERVTAVGLHIEGIVDVVHFEDLARRARDMRKPIVAVVAGRSEQGRRAAFSHTASITPSDAGIAAFFARLAIPRLRSLPELLEALKLLHVHGVPAGRDLCSMSCSGGDAALMADAAVGHTARFRPLRAEEKALVKATLSDFVAVANPLDYHTFIWGREEAMAETFSAMIGCGFDLVAAGARFSTRRPLRRRRLGRRGRGPFARRRGGPSGPSRLSPRCPKTCRKRGRLNSWRPALPRFAGSKRRWPPPMPPPLSANAGGSRASTPLLAARGSDAPSRTLYEAEAKAALAAFGLPVPAGPHCARLRMRRRRG